MIRPHRFPFPPRLLRFLPAALLFIAVAPTLKWIEFTNTPENLVVEAALEVRRSRQWFVPTLEGEQRTKKPPLATWVTAAAIRPSTLLGLGSTDPRAREAAYQALASDVRWPALLAICLTVAAAGELGAVLLNRPKAWAVAAVCASSFLLLRFCRIASADALLAMTVAIANLCLAHAAFARGTAVRWVACLGAGAALGLAFLTKGPVALAMTVVPLCVWRGWRRGSGCSRWGGTRRSAMPVVAAAFLFGAIALPWYAVVLLRGGGQWTVWWKEFTGSDAPEHADAFYTYLWLAPVVFLPWSVLVFATAWRARARYSLSPYPGETAGVRGRATHSANRSRAP